jgi:hypothetical protein
MSQPPPQPELGRTTIANPPHRPGTGSRPPEAVWRRTRHPTRNQQRPQQKHGCRRLEPETRDWSGKGRQGLRSTPASHDIRRRRFTQRLTISWPAASDNVGVIGYRIWLNGFEVATTAETRARLRWFNDDSGQHVVQIRAVDAAGNQSQSSPTLVITRPSPEPTATPTPEPSDSPTPTGEPSEHSHPDAQSPESPSAEATGQKSTAEPTPH